MSKSCPVLLSLSLRAVSFISNMISAYVLEIHCLELAHDLAKVWPSIGIVVPAALHQVEERTRRVSVWDLWSKAFFDDALTDDLAVNAVIGRFASCQLPHDHAEREYVSLLGILEALDDFRRHPLVSTNLASHDLSLDPGPAKIG